jgi:electron transport complex protein RnfC
MTVDAQTLGGALRSFRHGVHPHEHKGTADAAIERLPFGPRYVLLLQQNLGGASRPVVRAGDAVVRGQVIAEPAGFVSTCLHSPVTGRVLSVGPQRNTMGQLAEAIEIEADPFAAQRVAGAAVDWRALGAKEFITAVQRAGLVGMGGAAFPSHVKYAVPEGKKIEWLVVNGCECEPFLTSDHRLMVERADAVIRGAVIVATKLGLQGAKVGVEVNKLDAICALRQAVERARAAGELSAPVDVVALRVKYPQGAEKMLIKAIFDRAVPAGKLPLDIGFVVNNVGTLASLADYFDRGLPLIERVVTVAGGGVERPGNLLVPLGTPVRDVLQHAGLLPETRQVIMGGPMMGQPLPSLDVPVVKGTSGLLAFTEAEIDARAEYTCVRCGRCLEACANFLNPSRLARLARAERYEAMEAAFVFDCMECAACSFACPSGIPIVQLIRIAKAVIRERKKAAS